MLAWILIEWLADEGAVTNGVGGWEITKHSADLDQNLSSNPGVCNLPSATRNSMARGGIL